MKLAKYTTVLFLIIIISTGCSKSRLETTKEFVNDFVLHALTSPVLQEDTKDDAEAYTSWIENTKEEFKHSLHEETMDDIQPSTFIYLNQIFERFPASLRNTIEISNIEIEELSNDVFYATVELKDNKDTLHSVHARIQYKEDQISFVEFKVILDKK